MGWNRSTVVANKGTLGWGSQEFRDGRAQSNKYELIVLGFGKLVEKNALLLIVSAKTAAREP